MEELQTTDMSPQAPVEETFTVQETVQTTIFLNGHVVPKGTILEECNTKSN